MAFSKELINKVNNEADIVKIISSYISLTKKGKSYWGVCPFHDDTKPSLSVLPEKHVYTCWACGATGGVVNFVQRFEKIPFPEAVKKVADLSGIIDEEFEKVVKEKPVDPKKVPLLKCLSDLTLYYQYSLNTEDGEEALKYLDSRHLDETIRAKYKLGFAPKDGKVTCDFLQSKGHSIKTVEDVGIAVLSNGNYIDRNEGRVIFPIFDPDGNVVGYSARRIGDGPEAKYVNSPATYLFNKSTILYNYHIAKEVARQVGYLYICEGFMDVFALSKIGIDSVVAVMGVKLTKEHIAMIRKLNVEIRLCLDGDLAGQSAMMEISKTLAQAGLNVRIVDNQNSSKDPDEILNQDGPDALRTYVNNLISRVDFALNYFKNSNPLKTIDQKKALVKQFIPILLGINSQLELDSYLRKLAAVTGFEAESIRELLKKSKNDPQYNSAEDVMNSFHPERKALRRLEYAERELLFQMLNNTKAVAFYEEKIGTFYDEIYRQIANFLIDYAKDSDEISAVDIITMIDMSDVQGKNELLKEIGQLSFEETHNEVFSQELLDNLLATIEEEKDKIFEKDMLEQSLVGKSDLEKARILAEFNRRKMKKENQKSENKKGDK